MFLCVCKECVCACYIHVFACVLTGTHAQPPCSLDMEPWQPASFRLLHLTAPESPFMCGGFCKKKLKQQKEKLGKIN